MALTKSYSYSDSGYSELGVNPTHTDSNTAYIEPAEDGVYVKTEDSVAVALNILGHDRPGSDAIALGSVSIEDAVVSIASTPMTRDFQVNHAAALLAAADAYDQRAIHLATAEKRREAAADRLSESVAAISATLATRSFGGDEIGKLREALGRYDAALAN